MEYGSMSIQRLQSGRWLNWGIRFSDGGPHRQPDRRRLCPLCLGLHSGSRTGGRRGSGAAGRRDGGTAVSGLSASPGFGRRRHFDPDCRHGVPGHCLSAKALGAAGAGGRDGTGGGRYLCAAILRPAEPRRPLCRSIGPDRRFRPLLHPGCSSRRRTGWPRRGCCF